MDDAIISIAGTLLGTLLGWILAKIEFGKLKIHISKIENEKYERAPLNNSKNQLKKGELFYYSFEFVIKIYNSREKNKILRDLEVVFYGKRNKEIFTELVKDLNTKRIENGKYKVDNFGVLNIDGNSGQDFKAKVQKFNIDGLYITKKICFRYKKENFRCKTIKIQKFGENLEKRFLCDKEKDNG